MNMFKKIMAFGLVVSMGIPVLARGNRDNTAKIVGTIGVAAVTVGTVVYLSYRESNSAKIERATKLVYENKYRVQKILNQLQNFKDLYTLTAQPRSFKKEIIMLHDSLGALYDELQSRYSSWVTPWNWTKEMKEARDLAYNFYQQVKLLRIMLKYAPCLQSSVNSDSLILQEDLLIHAVRVMSDGTSAYPLVETVNQLNDDIRFIQNLTVYVSCEQLCSETLGMIRIGLIASKEYDRERQAYENYLQQQRLAQAAEAQARALREQVLAQSRQAAALEERNRIERNKKS